MNASSRLISPQFPRAARYHPDWILAGASGGANALALTEWLCQALPLQPGMRVLDLGCGRALSSIFLHREFNVQVWATDLWFSASENLQRIRDADVEQGVFPIHADARALPFASGFFDAIVSIDSFLYYGTDDHFLPSVARFLKPGGWIGIAQAGLTQELAEILPPHLQNWWSQERPLGLHSPNWWRRHWTRSQILDVKISDSLPNGWLLSLDWLRQVAPDNSTEILATETDAGQYLGYIRTVGRLKPDIQVPEPILAIPGHYTKQPLLRDPA